MCSREFALTSSACSPRPCGRRDVEDLLLGEAAAVREDLGGLRVAAAVVAAGGDQDEHDDRGEGEQPAGSIADELLALLRGTGLALTLFPLAAASPSALRCDTRAKSSDRP